MTARVTVVGSYPKPPHEGEEFALRRTLHALDRGDASLVDVRAAEDDLVREVIAEQAEAGIELVTDGQIRWDDAQTRFAEGLEGFGTTGLFRYFDTNTYFRQPVVKGPVARRGHIVLDEFLFARDHSPVPLKQTLIGPYTLAALSVDEHYGDRAGVTADLAAALNQEARDLADAGCEVIAFDEPALARIPGSPPGELDLLAEVAESLTEGIGAATILQTFFGDVAEHGPAFFELPFDGFGLDFVAGPGNVEAIHEFPGDKILQAGIVDARNTRLEDPDILTRQIESLIATVGSDRLWVSPSAGLEYLPREAAQGKCEVLADAARRYRGER